MTSIDLGSRLFADIVCPYCRSPLDLPDTVRCSSCHTLHHRACWREHTSCSVFGCLGQETTIDKAAIATLRRRQYLRVSATCLSMACLVVAYLLIAGRLLPGIEATIIWVLAFLLALGIASLQIWAKKCPFCGHMLPLHPQENGCQLCAQCGTRFLPAGKRSQLSAVK
jgi:LSD1 subclass zinc finger protein